MKFTLSFLFLLVFNFIFFTPPIQAQSTQAWTGRCVKSVTVDGQSFNDIATIQGLECLFFNILQVIVYFAGLAFFIMFIVGGFKYLISGGEQKAVAAASSTLTMAIIGLVGIIASWLFISFIQKFTGINIIHFIIPG